MTIEFELSYIFLDTSIPNITKLLKTKVVGHPINILDNYLNPNLRIRCTNKNNFVLTQKTGDKSSGKRTEQNQPITRATAIMLAEDDNLIIDKQRYLLVTNGKYSVTLDIVNDPMKIAILEIESTNGQMPPTADEIFGINLLECPMSAWNFFQRKIGICGAPSSGKTETAKSLSNLLNTQLHSNSFHVLEYATSFIQKYNRHPDAMDQFMLWYSQRTREDDAWSKAHIVISDSPTFLSYIYMMFHNKKPMSDQFKIHLAKLYKRVLEDIGSYDHIVYLKPSDLTKNNIRFHDTKEIHDIANRIYSFIQWHHIPHIIAKQDDVLKIFESLFFINKIGMEKSN